MVLLSAWTSRFMRKRILIHIELWSYRSIQYILRILIKRSKYWKKKFKQIFTRAFVNKLFKNLKLFCFVSDFNKYTFGIHLYSDEKKRWYVVMLRLVIKSFTVREKICAARCGLSMKLVCRNGKKCPKVSTLNKWDMSCVRSH